MDLKSLLSKIMMSGNFPFKIPDSNIVLTSSSTIEIDYIMSSWGTIVRKEVNVDSSFILALTSDISSGLIKVNTISIGLNIPSYIYFSKTGSKILMYGLDFLAKSFFETDSLIHIVTTLPQRYGCDVYLLSKEDGSLVELLTRIESDKVPKCEICSSKESKVTPVEYIYVNVWEDIFKTTF